MPGDSPGFRVSEPHAAVRRDLTELLNLSGRLDLNQRPFDPQSNALPDCATPRDAVSLGEKSARSLCVHVFVPGREPELRKCGRCKRFKPLAQFAWRRKNRKQRHNMCRPCHAKYHREHYLANKQRYIDQAAARKRTLRLRRTRFLIEYFRQHPTCVDCGENRSRRSGVRPSQRQGVRGHPQPCRAELAEHPGRDRQVRRALRQLPPAAHRRAAAVPAVGAHPRWFRCRIGSRRQSGRRGSNPLPRPWKGHVQPVTPRPRERRV